jgi:hypothetical protein
MPARQMSPRLMVSVVTVPVDHRPVPADVTIRLAAGLIL